MSFVSSKTAHHDLRYNLKMPLSELTLRKKRLQRILLVLLMVAAGGAARCLRITSPIHELCHVITANVVGGGGKLSGWAEATVWAEYGDPETAAALAVFHAFYGFLLLTGWTTTPILQEIGFCLNRS
jgi:hypothetical protein